MITRNITLRLGAVLALSIGCGGGGGGGGSGSGSVATDEAGRALHTAGGEAVTTAAHRAWTAGLAAFDDGEAHGWNEARCDAAIDKFDDANDEQGGSFVEAIYMIGVVHQRCGDRDEARNFYNRALSANQQFCKARAAIGVLELRGGNDSGAMSTFQRAIHDDPRCTEAYVNLGIIQRRRGDQREALDNLRRGLAIDSDYLPAFNQMALLYLDQAEQQNDDRRLDLAEVVCRQAQLINRDYAPIYNTWGLIKVRRGDIIEALRMFERATQLDRRMFEAFMNFGQITLSFRGYQDAKDAFTRAVQLRGRSYDAHIGLGAALRGLNQFDQAQSEYERALELDGNRPEAYFNLGILYQDYRSANANDPRPDLQRAVQYYNQFLSKARGNRSYANSVESVENRCRDAENPNRRRRRRHRSDCRPGRLQNIEMMVSALQEAQELQAEADRAQRQAAQQQRQQEQQEQQQQQQQQGGGDQ